jgi:hypothetical protein
VIVRSLSVIAGLLIGRPERAGANFAIQGTELVDEHRIMA